MDLLVEELERCLTVSPRAPVGARDEFLESPGGAETRRHRAMVRRTPASACANDPPGGMIGAEN